jgi:hypothetical protein
MKTCFGHVPWENPDEPCQQRISQYGAKTLGIGTCLTHLNKVWLKARVCLRTEAHVQASAVCKESISLFLNKYNNRYAKSTSQQFTFFKQQF